jgi:hypothetical protein
MSLPTSSPQVPSLRTLFVQILGSIALTIFVFALTVDAYGGEQWSVESASKWYSEQPWLVGCNFLPSNSINQIEMWEQFDAETNDRELGWAKSLGFNTIRVFLHDACWKQDKDKFYSRVDEFLDICERHSIRPMIVLFDGVWDPDPQLGPQRRPRDGVHNSGWVQGPGRVILSDPEKQDQLEGYVTEVIARYKDDKRVLAWDLFNEPDNPNGGSYGPLELPNKDTVAARLVRRSFEWARQVDPSQPLTVCVWQGPPWDESDKLNEVHRAALELSDVISFHDYNAPAVLEARITQLRKTGRPLICTEFMARGNGSTFEAILPVLKKEKIGAYCWGLVDGKSQTKYPWTTWKKPIQGEPSPWHHDIFRADGAPYSEGEVALIKKLTDR